MIFNSYSSLPVGSYICVAGQTAPDGFIACNGAAISRTLYPELFKVIGITYGAGDGSTTFNLPNLWDRVLWGGTAGQYRNAGLPNITGTTSIVGDGNYNPTGCFYDGGRSYGKQLYTNETRPWSVAFNAARSNNIYGASSTVQPPALTTLICIKY